MNIECVDSYQEEEERVNQIKNVLQQKYIICHKSVLRQFKYSRFVYIGIMH